MKQNEKSEKKAPIGKEEVRRAATILDKYRAGKRHLEMKIVENEQWYKLRHWACMRKSSDVEPSSGWLLNTILTKHAEAMDNFPSPNVLPREADDEAEARMLSSVLPVLLAQSDFEKVYSDEVLYKLKTGCGVFGVFWDPDAAMGLGDAVVKKIDLINLFWEPGVTDIQASANLFHVELCDFERLRERWPEAGLVLSADSGTLARYLYDDAVDTSEKAAVVDWYYRKNGLLHYCKFVGDTVLYATENDPAMAETGFYDHGEYPFVFDPLFPMEGSPAGFGYIDVGKSAQEFIDRGSGAIMKNMLANAAPRFFVRDDGQVREDEFADFTRAFVHTGSGVITDAVVPIASGGLAGIYLDVLNAKIDELKEVTGNRDVMTGGTSSGVTAASAIAAMQEAGSKLSRDQVKATYRAFRKVCLLLIELIRQFYDLPRTFRITGEDGKIDFVRYSAEKLRVQEQEALMGIPMGKRKPVFDIEVTAEKASPYTRLSRNELALQFYQVGFFDPQRADQALMCLDMMDFDGKQKVMEKIAAARERQAPAAGMAQGSITGTAVTRLAGSEPAAVRAARERVTEATSV